MALLALAITTQAAAQADADVRNEVRSLVASAALPELRWPRFPDYRQWLDRFYGPADYAPQWLEGGRPRPIVAVAIAEMHAAADRGLSPEDYDVDWLERETQALEHGDITTQRVARTEVALTVSVLRYISDLHVGRIHPRYAEFQYEIEDKEYDLAELLQDALAQDQLGPVIDAAEPAFPIYLRLKELLARYRRLALQEPAALPPLPPKVKKIQPGEPYSGSTLLRERLEMLGDLPADAPAVADNRYAGVLVEAVKRFQDRHGINADGVLGRETLAQLNVPMTQRVRQIELSLERLRWLPDLPRGPVIAVNIPSYRLQAFGDLPSSDRPALTTPVIVGRAGPTRTPVFVGDMRYVEFSPYWNVPRNIQKKEMLPKVAHDPAFLEREDMELVGTSNAGHVTTAISGETLAALRSGKLRLRQRPGPKNVLGGIKFVLPNTMDIYLHGTPAQQLFDRTRRDFSHGCIRVADPVGLAQFALRDQPEWTAERILEAMSAGKTSTVKLTQPLPVVIFYTTVIVDNDGRALFLPDVYHYDEKLEKLLRAGYPYPDREALARR